MQINECVVRGETQHAEREQRPNDREQEDHAVRILVLTLIGKDGNRCLLSEV